jgi:hypothetical protein
MLITVIFLFRSGAATKMTQNTAYFDRFDEFVKFGV